MEGIMRKLTGLAVSLCGLLCVCTASAQDTKSFGVTMGYPASIGVLWHLNEAVAVRPEFSFDLFSSETDNSSPIVGANSSDGHAVSVGLSALFYLARWDMTRAYLVPRYAYSHTSSSIEGPFTFGSDSTGNVHDVSVSFGAQHNLGDRFAIYGELGLAYERAKTEITTSELRRTAFGTRSGVGVVIYF
jgi:opacity protein-like surface antigen